MPDPTESNRRKLVAEINAEPGSREALEAAHGQVWDTSEMTADFEPLSFMAPFIVVRRKVDGAMGSLQFQHSPRLYYSFKADG